jgi:ribose/xylose/arabinose/galactoside ABC-type transport system permease subunit
LWAIGVEIEVLPAIGELVLGGFFSSLVAGAMAGAAGGGLVGSLIAAGLPRHEAERYQQEVHAGRIIVTVHTDDRYDDALDILRANGAEIQSGDRLV